MKLTNINNLAIATTVILVTTYSILIHGFPRLNENFSRESQQHNPFVGFFIFPHGGITLDPQHMDYSDQPAFNKNTSKEEAINLNNAMQQAAESLVNLKPDLIILSTPHGYRVVNSILTLSAKSASGDVGNIWSNFTADFQIDANLSTIIYQELRGKNESIDILNLGSGDDDMKLLWAEAIPWNFIQTAAKKVNHSLPSVVYLGQSKGVPRPHILQMGREIVKTILSRAEFSDKSRIAVVVSGDMSHYHSEDPSSPYPYSPFAQVFDEYLVNWAKIDRKPQTESASYEQLISNAGSIEDKAGTCGYTGFVMLHGMLEEIVQNQNWNYIANFYRYEVPSYFGMMVVNWLPDQSIVE